MYLLLQISQSICMVKNKELNYCTYWIRHIDTYFSDQINIPTCSKQLCSKDAFQDQHIVRAVVANHAISTVTMRTVWTWIIRNSSNYMLQCCCAYHKWITWRFWMALLSFSDENRFRFYAGDSHLQVQDKPREQHLSKYLSIQAQSLAL